MNGKGTTRFQQNRSLLFGFVVDFGVRSSPLPFMKT